MTGEKDTNDTNAEEKLNPPANKKERKIKTNEEYFKEGMLLLVGVIVAIAAFQLYFSVGSIINTWFEYQYIPIFKSVYYLIVIVAGLFILNKYLISRGKN